MPKQSVLAGKHDPRALDPYLRPNAGASLLLVCGPSMAHLPINRYFDSLQASMGIRVVKFTDFHPNPCMQSVAAGVKLFADQRCQVIAAVGGGSAIDVAKCIKLFATADPSRNYLEQRPRPNRIPLIAVPTTAGSGSEATKFAVVYSDGEKQSIADESCIPSVVLLDGRALETLPLYQKKSTMMDAFCHALESLWSIHSTAVSKRCAKEAIRLILRHAEAYMAGDCTVYQPMMHAAFLAGKAINIAQTTAGHAMCYKLTSFYGIAHGHAAALCVAKLFPYLVTHIEDCVDARGKAFLASVFDEIAGTMGCSTAGEAVAVYQNLLDGLCLGIPTLRDPSDLSLLAASVNPVRLQNTPVALSPQAIQQLYRDILHVSP